MQKRSLALIAIVSVLLGTSTAAWSGVSVESFVIIGPAVPGSQLFVSVGAQGAPGPEAGPGATVAWPVTLDRALLDTLPATLAVNFPDRDAITLTRLRSERRGPGAFLWTGRNGECSAMFSASPGWFRGTLSCLNAPYGIAQVLSGPDLRLTRYDDAGAAGLEPEPLAIPPGELAESSPATGPQGAADQAIDILVLYNAQVRQQLDPGGGRVNTMALMRYAVDQTQLAMDVSTTAGQPVIAQVNFLTAREISIPGISYPPDDLNYLDGDPETLALRDYWRADVIVYVTINSPGNVIGIARMPLSNGMPEPGPDFANHALAVVVHNFAVNDGDFVFAHEFAHTLGANHNPEQGAGNPTPVRPWAFGHWELDKDRPNYGNRTIMSYEYDPPPAGPPGGLCTLLCPRILHYSNPGVYAGWFQTGTPWRDNARLIDEIAPTTALYRTSLGRIYADGFE